VYGDRKVRTNKCVTTELVYCFYHYQRPDVGVFTTEHEHNTNPLLSPRWRLSGIADVPMIACQSGSMSDGITSSLENCHLISDDGSGTVNPAYHRSLSDSDRSLSQERDGESVPKRTSRRLSGSLGISSTQKPANAQDQVTHADLRMESSASVAGTDMELISVGDIIESGKSFLDQHLSEDMTAGYDFESNESALQQTSTPIGAKLVVTSPALSQQNSVRVPAPLPYTCTSVSNATASSYSDSELIPRRNSVPQSVTKMVATEHRVRKQQPELPQVFPSSSVEILGERRSSSFKQKPMTADQRRQNHAEIHQKLRQWHLHRSLSAGNTPGSRHPLPDNGSTRSSRPRMRNRHLNHSVSSSADVPVHGSADVAGVTPDSLLSLSPAQHPLDVASVSANSAPNNSSSFSTMDNTTTPENSSAEISSIHMSAAKERELLNMQTEDNVFEDELRNNPESSSAVVIEQTESTDQSPSTSANTSEHHTDTGVPNRAILRRGSGE